MARKPMVTRSIKSTVVNALCLNVETAEPSNESFELARTYATEDKLMKALKENYETETLKIVHVVDTHEKETLYGMSENEFMKHAVELDPATRKALATEDTEADAE